MSVPNELGEPTPDEIAAAAKWWLGEREGWVLDRALRVWLTYEADGGVGYWWGEDQTLYNRWYAAVLAAAYEVAE